MGKIDLSKKNIAIIASVCIVALAIIIGLVSSGNDGNKGTTTPPFTPQTGIPATSSTAPSSGNDIESTTAPSSEPSSQSGNVQGVTYILTTRADKTVPWSETTRFEIDSMSAYGTTGSALPTGIGDVSTPSGDIQKPVVNTSELSTSSTSPTSPTVPTLPNESSATSSTSATGTTKPKTTNATTAANKTPTQLIINDTSYNSSTSLITLAVSDEGWQSSFNKSSQNIKIIVDGEALDTTVPCAVTGKVNADGCQLITIDLSSQGLNAGSNVTFTIPAGLIQTKAGTQYNTSYTGYVIL